MPMFTLNPPAPGLSPEDYRKYIKDGIKAEINRIGVENVLKHEPFVILFSGPSETVRFTIGRDPLSNNDRSLAMAIEVSASRITDTQAAVFLDGQNLDDYFRPTLAPLYSNPRKLTGALNAAYAIVWGGISELFAELDFKRVATAVCGAGPDRVFVKDELPALVKNAHVEVINDIDMSAVRKMFNEVSADEAFKLVCLSELKMVQRKAEADTIDPAKRWQDFSDRRYFFELERKDTKSTTAPLTPEQEQFKQDIVTQFGLADLCTTLPSTWGGPLVPKPVVGTTPQRLTLH
jgi:hypothetical protein